MKNVLMNAAALGLVALTATCRADPVPVVVTSGLITFDEVPIGPTVPILHYAAGDYAVTNPLSTPSGVTAAHAVAVSFGNFFTGQSLIVPCVNGTDVGCVTGTPDTPLSLSLSGTGVFTAALQAGSVDRGLGGSPDFFGSIAILFGANNIADDGQSSVEFDAGIFNSTGAMRVTYYDRAGVVLDTEVSVGLGMQHFGLTLQANRIAGVLLSSVGPDSAGWGIDNLAFSAMGECTDRNLLWADRCQARGTGIPAPPSMGSVALALLGLGWIRRRSSMRPVR